MLWQKSPSKNNRLWLIVLLLASLSSIPANAKNTHAQNSGILNFFEPVTGTLNEEVRVEEWKLEGRADQVISILVTTKSGDLDPMVQIVDPFGNTTGENDDLDSLVRDAGLEALVLPVDGLYTVRVMRYTDPAAEADTGGAGEYELTASLGFARLERYDTFAGGSSPWLSATSPNTVLTQGRLQLRAAAQDVLEVATPQDAGSFVNFYAQVDAQLTSTTDYAEFGMVFRRQVVLGRVQNYQFRINTQGRWSVVLRDGSNQYTLHPWSANAALDTSAWTLAVITRDMPSTRLPPPPLKIISPSR